MFLKSGRMAATLLLAATIVLSLASCATMSPEECKSANWRDVGHRDGLNGKPLSLLSTRASDCAESNVRVDNAAYLKGRDAGLRNFCQPENAAQFGLNGGNYEGVCPPQIDGEFRRHFQLGRNVYVYRSEVNQIDSSIQSKEQRLRTLDRDENKRVRDANNEDDRRRARKDIDDERRRIRNELRDLERNLRRARDNLRDAEWAMDRVR